MSTMPHHSCRFLGGPKDGQILEIADVSTEIPCSDGIYTRHGNTFIFHMNSTRHDCAFIGGPEDGKIREIGDEIRVFGVGYVGTDASRMGDYVRSSPTAFTFRPWVDDVPAEPKPETWRDRAIREPML